MIKNILALLLSLSCATQAQIGVTREQLLSRWKGGEHFGATEQAVRGGELAYLPGGAIYFSYGNHGAGITLDYSLSPGGVVRFEGWHSDAALAPAAVLKLSESDYAWTEREPGNWFGLSPGKPPLHAWYHDAPTNHYLLIAPLAAAPDKGAGGLELLDYEQEVASPLWPGKN